MKLYFSGILALVLLSGCAQVALYHDRQDPCQGESASLERKRELGRPADYKRPEWCFAGRGFVPSTRIVDASGKTVGYIKP